MPAAKLFDGSFSVELKRRGYDCKDKPLWSFDAVIEVPETVKDVHKGFIDCGCEMISTNTYHASIPLMNKHHDQAKQDQLIELACNLAREAVKESDKSIEIWGAIGSYGVQFRDASEYNASYLENLNCPQLLEIMTKYYLEHMVMLIEKGGMQQLIIETLPSLSDARAVRNAADELHKLHPETVLIVSFTIKENHLLRHGEHLSEAVETIRNCPNIIGIGLNCTNPSNITPSLEVIKKYDHKFKYIVVYPNQGYTDGGEKTEVKVDCFTKLVPEWIGLGATVIGGCCGAGVETLEIIKNAIAHHN